MVPPLIVVHVKFLNSIPDSCQPRHEVFIETRRDCKDCPIPYEPQSKLRKGADIGFPDGLRSKLLKGGCIRYYIREFYKG